MVENIYSMYQSIMSAKIGSTGHFILNWNSKGKNTIIFFCKKLLKKADTYLNTKGDKGIIFDQNFDVSMSTNEH